MDEQAKLGQLEYLMRKLAKLRPEKTKLEEAVKKMDAEVIQLMVETNVYDGGYTSEDGLTVVAQPGKNETISRKKLVEVLSGDEYQLDPDEIQAFLLKVTEVKTYDWARVSKTKEGE